MVINNFEFGVPSHLSPVSITTYCHVVYMYRYILKLILFIPMVAPSSYQWRNSILMVRWRHHSLRLGVVCTCPPKTMSSAWKCLPSPHFTNTYEAKKYSLKLFKGLSLHVKYHAFYITLPRWKPHDAATFDLGVHPPLKLVTRRTRDGNGALLWMRSLLINIYIT